MRLFRHPADLPADARGAVVALGNFDGVHRGHRAVIGGAQAHARALQAPSAVLTFEPHPRSLFRPDDPPFRLTPLRIKARLLEAMGIDLLFVVAFDEAVSRTPAEQFVTETLGAGLGAKHLVCGHDFVFGHNRGGDPALLQRLGPSLGFGVTVVAPVGETAGGETAVGETAGEIFSSTRVRARLQAGDPAGAAAILGHPFEIEGRVEHGDKRGRLIGFPTANLDLGEYQRPRFGVYAVEAGVDEGGDTHWHPGVANIGRRPTVGGTVERLEVHLFDVAPDLYGRHLRVRLLHFIRPEQTFDGLDALKAQIAQDAATARTLLATP